MPVSAGMAVSKPTWKLVAPSRSRNTDRKLPTPAVIPTPIASINTARWLRSPRVAARSRMCHKPAGRPPFAGGGAFAGGLFSAGAAGGRSRWRIALGNSLSVECELTGRAETRRVVALLCGESIAQSAAKQLTGC